MCSKQGYVSVMAINGAAQAEIRKEVRKKLLWVKAVKRLENGKRLTNQAMADIMGVSRQALDAFVKMKMTPRPYVLYNACKAWDIEFEIAGKKFGIKDFAPAAAPGPLPAPPIQQNLLEALASLGPDNLDFSMKPVGSALEVKMFIRFSGQK
jgi:transcriptional regulator with XRE-family HTH domain